MRLTGLVVPMHAEATAGGGAATLEWALLALTVVGLGVYLRGLVRLRRHEQGRRQQRGRPWALAAGVVVVAVIAGSPLGELLEQRLSTHMAQHVVLIMVAAPLLAWSAPGVPVLAGLPGGVRRPLTRLGHHLPVRTIGSAPVAWLASVGTMLAWHLPGPYDLAVGNELAHLAEHASFLLTAWWFWWHLLAPSAHRLRGIPAVGYVVASIPPGALLGAVLVFAQHPVYPSQAELASDSGIAPLLDQRIGGLVMWAPMDFAYMAIAITLFGRWLASAERTWAASDYAVVGGAQAPMDEIEEVR